MDTKTRLKTRNKIIIFKPPKPEEHKHVTFESLPKQVAPFKQ